MENTLIEDYVVTMDKKHMGRACVKTQFHIQDASRAEDRAQVEQLLVATATEFDIADTTVTSLVPDTIRCYSERIGYGFAIGARVVGEIVIIDFNEGKEQSPRFTALKARLTGELRRIFGNRLTLPKEFQYVPIQSSLPISEAAREFIRKHYGRNNASAPQ